MNIDKHKERLKESLQVIGEAIDTGIVERQRTIGFRVSAASADLFEIYLHKNNLIDPGFIVKHEWFKSKNKLREKFPFDFKYKKEMFNIMHNIETKRNMLCYGIPQKEEIIQKVLSNFNELKDLFKENGVEIE
ncbi:MAG: hypothetical protein KJ623_03060 [Nanoarchaeota archaeon]|nr:hypothetical protein [Nanoarchaeota archaeon]MBU0962631.1 hypothetical protein [Nanoarchaeota archaeon]